MNNQTTASKSKIDDELLIKEYLLGSQSAFNELFSRHQQKIQTYIFGIVGDKQISEDVFQETFIKILDGLKNDKYQDTGKFLPWTLRIAYNCCMDYFRIKNTRAGKLIQSVELDENNSQKDDRLSHEEYLIKEEIGNEIIKVLEKIPEDQKEIILLRHYGNLSFREISELTGIGINTVLGRMRYGLINLKKLIGSNRLEMLD